MNACINNSHSLVSAPVGELILTGALPLESLRGVFLTQATIIRNEYPLTKVSDAR